VHDTLLAPEGTLEAETRLHLVVERLAELLTLVPAVPPDLARAPDLAEAVRVALDAELFERPSIAALARVFDASPTFAARAFRDTFGLPPHEYVVTRRLEAARARILDGEPIVDVAAATGFADQAHLTNRFRRLFGTTPARARRQQPPRSIAVSRPRRP
jgi:AraC-like DNA-binding protein